MTIWNQQECGKVAGNSALYLAMTPHCEVYAGHGKDRKLAGVLNKHVPIWDKVYQRNVTGNAAPRRKNLEAHICKHAECEVYNVQDTFHLQPSSSVRSPPTKAASAPSRITRRSWATAPAPRSQTPRPPRVTLCRSASATASPTPTVCRSSRSSPSMRTAAGTRNRRRTGRWRSFCTARWCARGRIIPSGQGTYPSHTRQRPRPP